MYFRAIWISFLVTPALLTLVGLWLLYDSSMRLIHRERVPVGTMTIGSHTFWSGCAMIAALVYCAGVGVLLGRLEKPVADSLVDKALAADDDMNEAGWMSEGSAIIGIVSSARAAGGETQQGCGA